MRKKHKYIYRVELLWDQSRKHSSRFYWGHKYAIRCHLLQVQSQSQLVSVVPHQAHVVLTAIDLELNLRCS